MLVAKVADSHSVTAHSRASWAHETGLTFEDTVVTKRGTYFIVFGTQAHLAALRALPAFSDVFAVPAALKISPLLHTELASTTEPSIDFDIALRPGALTGSPESAAELSDACQEQLTASGLSGSCSAHGRRTLVVAGIQASHAREAAAVLARQSTTAWVEPRLRVELLNKYGQWITQSDAQEERPVWGAGLRGGGEVVGVADGGLDVHSCFFADAARPVPFPLPTGTVYNDPEARKVVQYVAYADGADANRGHGTHVCGSIAGSSPNPGEAAFDGMAKRAQIAFFDIGLPGGSGLDVPAALDSTMLPFAFSAGARLHSNSWGSYTDQYTATARAFDAFAWEHQDFLSLIAAGNGGSAGAGSLGSPATAKNILAVGASQSSSSSFNALGSACPTPTSANVSCQDSMAGFSSIGPTADGRTKPDLVAPGHRVVSARASYPPQPCTPSTVALTAKSGTSMATPIAAGSAALVRQYFREGYYPTGAAVPAHSFLPMAAAVKAVLLNGAVRLPGTFRGQQLNVSGPPSMIQGYGRLSLNTSLPLAGSSSSGSSSGSGSGSGSGNGSGNGIAMDLAVLGDYAAMRTLDTAQQHNYTLVVTRTPSMAAAAGGGSGGSGGGASPLPLRVTLVWQDYPGTLGAARALVNDLDLTLTAPDDSVLLGNSGGGGGNSSGSPDRLNNAEQITVAAPAVGGSYNISVRGAWVPQGPQPYALVVTGSFSRASSLFARLPILPSITPSSLPLHPPSSPSAPAAVLAIAGYNFAPVPSDNAVALACDATPSGAPLPVAGASLPTATVTAGDASSLLLRLSGPLNCPTQRLYANVRAAGFGSQVYTLVASVVAQQQQQ